MKKIRNIAIIAHIDHNKFTRSIVDINILHEQVIYSDLFKNIAFFFF